MLSLFWVLLVVAQPTVNANRAMTLIILSESRTCFMILGSFQVALFLICHRRPLTARRPANSPLRFARSNAYLTRILPERSSAEQLDFGRTTPCPIVCGDPMTGRNVLLALLTKMPLCAFWNGPSCSNNCADRSLTAEQSCRHEGSVRRMNQGVSLLDAHDSQVL